jgi:hypothetical protein
VTSPHPRTGLTTRCQTSRMGDPRAPHPARIGGLRRRVTEEEYITANRALDANLERLTRQKAELVEALRSPQHEDFVDASIRQFCASARARFQACADFDAKRQFLVGHVGRVIFNRYKVTVTGSVPVQSASGDAKLQFRIKGEIDRKAVRSRSRTMRTEDGHCGIRPGDTGPPPLRIPGRNLVVVGSKLPYIQPAHPPGARGTLNGVRAVRS